jgi:hypothetical protein
MSNIEFGSLIARGELRLSTLPEVSWWSNAMWSSQISLLSEEETSPTQSFDAADITSNNGNTVASRSNFQQATIMYVSIV